MDFRVRRLPAGESMAESHRTLRPSDSRHRHRLCRPESPGPPSQGHSRSLGNLGVVCPPIGQPYHCFQAGLPLAPIHRTSLFSKTPSSPGPHPSHGSLCPRSTGSAMQRRSYS